MRNVDAAGQIKRTLTFVRLFCFSIDQICASSGWWLVDVKRQAVRYGWMHVCACCLSCSVAWRLIEQKLTDDVQQPAAVEHVKATSGLKCSSRKHNRPISPHAVPYDIEWLGFNFHHLLKFASDSTIKVLCDRQIDIGTGVEITRLTHFCYGLQHSMLVYGILVCASLPLNAGRFSALFLSGCFEQNSSCSAKYDTAEVAVFFPAEGGGYMPLPLTDGRCLVHWQTPTSDYAQFSVTRHRRKII
ncbi:hypothetical protein T05_5224 [Trichinella murrelli]|uniref:Uncharacterized protein n=3 Tax=Trichinella TaxID=6333 RepID=A0A0V0UAW1_9BILA|nr:hypothetical protein T05_5224 [Trichinella murrelli]